MRRVLYRLPEVIPSEDVLIVEGEKDADTAKEKLDLCGTTGGGAAEKWLDEYTVSLAGKDCVIIADADESGRKKARTIAHALSGKARSVRLLELPGAKDLTEWVECGGTLDALVELVRNTPEWKPTAETPNSKVGAVLRCFSDIAPKPLRWLWAGRIPLGKLTLLIGDPGLGKSLLTTEIASRVTRGASSLTVRRANREA